MAVWRLLHNGMELEVPRAMWNAEVQGEEEEGRTEDARRASRDATEEHGKPIN